MQGGSKMNTKNDPQIARAGIVEMISWAAPPDLPAEHPLALTGLTTSAASMLIFALPSPVVDAPPVTCSGGSRHLSSIAGDQHHVSSRAWLAALLSPNK
jgi:hypothetical protein